MELHWIFKSHKMEGPRQEVHDHQLNQRDFFLEMFCLIMLWDFFFKLCLLLIYYVCVFMGFVCLVDVCLCMCFWHFFSLCVSVCFVLCLFAFFVFNLACCFSKEREKEGTEWMGEKVGRIWEEMRKGKSFIQIRIQCMEKELFSMKRTKPFL